MTEKEIHACEEHLEEHLATPEQPYRYVGSGLPNVFLAGIKYFVCKICGKQSAEIPAIKELLSAVARSIVKKQSRLTGPEVRFLRKRLSKKGIEFAPMIGITPEHLSRVEGTEKPLEDAGRDRLIRLIYLNLAGDDQLKKEKVFSIEKKFEEWITALFGPPERIVAERRKNKKWAVETAPLPEAA